jgi:predicted permease|tara:strand:- start:2270 stop:3160 length:891 start_codon:yes stop_codon:yes gene_type:complete
MFSELFAIIAPILVCASIGFVWAKSGTSYPADFVARAVMNIGAPCLVVAALNRAEVDLLLFAQVALSALLVLASMAVISVAAIGMFKLKVSTFLPSLLFPNCGNMGLPLCLFAFGEEGLALALGYFLVMMLGHFSIGILIVGSGHNRLSQRLLDLLKMPVLYAMALGVVLLFTGWSLPQWLDNSVTLLSGFTIPLMMITLGVSLAQLKVAMISHSLAFSSLRIFGGLALGWLCCASLGIEGISRGVVLLQSSMPVAVFNYLLAQRFNREPSEVAGLVVTSTLMSFVLTPLLLAYLL